MDKRGYFVPERGPESREVTRKEGGGRLGRGEKKEEKKARREMRTRGARPLTFSEESSRKKNKVNEGR